MKNATFDFKKLLPHVLAIGILILINTLYFYPQLQGKRIEAADSLGFTGWTGELKDYTETGETYHWNNAMFSGMPWELLTLGQKDNFVRPVDKLFKLGFGSPISLFLSASLCTYLALILLGLGPFISFIGAIAFAFNTNYMVLIGAGHQAKVMVINYFPLILSGFILCFRSKFILGAIILALASSLAILNNHIQMVYYLLLALLVMAIIYLIAFIKENKTTLFGKTAVIILAAAVLGAVSNFAQLYSAKDFSNDTMRGKPILELDTKEAKSSSEVDGLEWNYAMQWSNSFGDLLSVLIPRIVGGSSQEEVGPDTEIGKLIRGNGGQRGSDGNYTAPLYWGALPFTSGPYYIGATVFLLFTLSLFLIEPKLRYGIIAASVLICLLSMGSNFSILNRTLFDYLPLFNKFRAPNSAMSLIPVFVVIPAMIGLRKLMNSDDRQAILKKLRMSTIIVGGSCLIIWLFADVFLSYSAPSEAQYSANIKEIFSESRSALARADAFRSLAFVLVAVGLIWAFLAEKLKSKVILLTGLCFLITVDHWAVDKRYLDNDNFVSTDEYFAKLDKRPVDTQIVELESKGRSHYRVLDLSISTFNSSATSYHHNTIGGYHPAKLQRYQDLIDYYISKGNQQVLNMLNTKYVIGQDQRLQINNQALGNAWFVNDLIYVNSANEEIEKLGSAETANQAVILRDEFDEQLANFTPGDGQGSIELVEYQPNRLVYTSNTSSEQLAVFSEIWYRGWNVTIDDQPAEMIRANYTLRALKVPAGQHTIVFSFTPVAKGAIISNIGSILVLLSLVIGGIVLSKNKESVPEPSEERPAKRIKKVKRRTKK